VQSSFAEFLQKPWEERKHFHTGKSLSSGYKKLVFPNRDNTRDPEERDAFQLYWGIAAHYAAVKWPTTEFKHFFEASSVLPCLLVLA
jgi:hypothetical protein